MAEKTRTAQSSAVVQRERFAALSTKTDVVPKAMKKNFIDFFRNLLPALIEPILIHWASKRFGKRKVKI